MLVTIETCLTAAAVDVAGFLVVSVMPAFLASHNGARFVNERVLMMGLPSWSVPQVAKLMEPARLVAVMWVQRSVRGYLVRCRFNAVVAEGRLRQSRNTLKDELAHIAAAENARRVEANLLREAAERVAAELAAEEALAIAAQLAFEAQEALNSREAVLAVAETQRLKDKLSRELEAEEDADYHKALLGGMVTVTEERLPPLASARDTFAEGLFAAAAEEAAAAAAIAVAEVVRDERARLAAAPFASSYLKEVTGTDGGDSVTVFQALIAAGESEEVAWAGFRKTENATQDLEAALAAAEGLGIARPAKGTAFDTMTVEAAVAAARGAAARNSLGLLSESLRFSRAATMVQRVLRVSLAKRRVARKCNREWVPVSDAASGAYYYTNVKTGVSTWVLPRLLPARYVTLKAVCVACTAALAVAQCVVCDEAYCAHCLAAVHAIKKARSRHFIFYLPEAGSPSSALQARVALAPLTDKVPGLAADAGVPERQTFAASIEAAFAGPSDGLCLGCDRRLGTRYCGSCEVLYCAGCWPAMHSTGNRERHKPWILWKPTHNPEGKPLVDVGVAGAEESAKNVGAD